MRSSWSRWIDPFWTPRNTRRTATPTTMAAVRFGLGLALRGAVNAEAGRRHGLEARGGDGLPAVLTQPVGAALVLGEGVLDVVEGVAQRGGQRFGLAPFRRDLARIGEVGVVIEAAELLQ